MLVVDDKRRLQLPEGIPFEAGEPLHMLWDGNVLQFPHQAQKTVRRLRQSAGRRQPRDGHRRLAQRLAQDRERQRKKFDEVRNQFFKDDPSKK